MDGTNAPSLHVRAMPGLPDPLRSALERLGVRTIAGLATRDADDLFLQLCMLDRRRHDLAVRHALAAAVDSARQLALGSRGPCEQAAATVEGAS